MVALNVTSNFNKCSVSNGYPHVNNSLDYAMCSINMRFALIRQCPV